MRKTSLMLLLFLVPLGLPAQDLAVVGAKVYASPTAEPVANTTILIRGGKIVSVGQHLSIPNGVETLQCAKCFVFAGFWNTHVHFMEAKWAMRRACRLKG
jgi:dihydroorotase-like cyclic amidohydrolase